MVDGNLGYVSVASRSERVDGWRDQLWDGGCLIDVASGEVAVDGLSLPHAPRYYQDRLWLLDSGSGNFGFVDPNSGTFEPIVSVSGLYARPRLHRRFSPSSPCRPSAAASRSRGSSSAAISRDKNAYPQCAVAVVDIRKGALVHWMRVTGSIQEIGGVAAIEGAARPAAIGQMTDEICRVLSIGPDFTPAQGSLSDMRRHA